MRRWLVFGAVLAAARGGLCERRGFRSRATARLDVVAPFYPVAAAAAARRWELRDGREPHAGGGRAARPRAHARPGRRDPGRRGRVRDGSRLPARRRGRGRPARRHDGGAARPAGSRAPKRSDPHVWLDPVLYSELVDAVATVAGRARCRRAGTRSSRTPPRSRPRSTAVGRRVRGRAARLRPRHDRDRARRVRLSRRPVRPGPGGHRGDLTGGGAERANASAISPTSWTATGSRRSSPRSSSRRGSRTRWPARPAA